MISEQPGRGASSKGSLPGAWRGPPPDQLRPERVFRGNVMDLGGNRPFLLDGRQAFVVLRGDIHVFSVARRGGAPSGPRRHLFRVSAGGLLLGLGPEASGSPRALLAVATNGTQVELGTHQDLQALLGQGKTADRAFALLESWVEVLSTGLGPGPRPEPCLELALPDETDIPRGPVAMGGTRAVAWVMPLAGQALLAGRPDLALPESVYTPLSPRGWLTVPEAARLRSVATSGLPDEEALWGGLAALAGLVLRNSQREVAEDEAAQSERAREKELAGAATLVGACERLAGALRPPVFGWEELADQEPIQDASNGQAAVVLAACRLVGAAAGIAIRTPARIDERAVLRDPLGSILRSSRVRARKVALRGDWWRHDNGPLLGFVAGEEKAGPVALLRRGPDYWICRPWVGTGAAAGPAGPGSSAPRFERVTAETVATLVPFGFSLYRAFPDARLGLKALMRFGFRGCARDLALVVVMGLLSALLGMMPAMATGMLFNDIVPGAQRSQLIQMAILLMAAAVGNTAFSLARGIALLRIRTRTGTSLQAAVWDRLLRVPLRFFRSFTAGNLAVRASAIDSIQQILSGATLATLMNGVFALMNLVLMFHYSKAMAWRGLALLAIAVAVNLAGGLLQLRPQRGLIELQARISGLVLELLSSIGKIRVAGAEVRAYARWAAPFAKQRQLQFTVQFIRNWLQSFQSAFPLLASVVMYWTVVPLLSAGEPLPRTGDFLAFLASFGACLGGLLGACSALLGALAVLPLYDQARPILEATPEVDKGRSAPGPLLGDIEVQHASFRYHPDAPLVLRDVSFHVRPGEFVAFVGASGSGKSTLLRLLLGFESLESGSIHYDGQELGALDIQEVRRQMGVVLQNGQLMAGDIHTNIAGAGTASLEQAWEAARMAGLAEDIESMPMGMHTVINDGAGTLSGGQRQRLMIARAIVNRPKIILFDEATSALDNRNQAVVSASLEQLRATRIVVAHRLSTIINADRIYVLERGRIVQCGTYPELMADGGGLFAELARRQIT